MLTTNLKTLTGRLHHEEEGVTMIEYGLLAALIAVALIATIILVRNGLVDTFSSVATAMS